MVEVQEPPACRICFNVEGADASDSLLRPCDCRGSQAWVHRSCLQTWQRCVQLSPYSHHPADVAREDRHVVCNVCKKPFNLAPPSRAELLADLAGLGLAALRPGLLLVSSRQAPGNLPAEGMPLLLQVLCEVKHRHFKNSVYLLTEQMEEHSGRGNNMTDAILGVNLVRRMEGEEEPTLQALTGLEPDEQVELRAEGVQVEVYNGGPVNAKTVTALCLVSAEHRPVQGSGVEVLLEAPGDPGGGSLRPWLLVVGRVPEVLRLARAEAERSRSRSEGSRAEAGLAHARVLCFAGYAVWSRTQLLGEVARGSWRYRPGDICDVLPLPDRPDSGGWVPPEERFDHCSSHETAPPLSAASPNDLSRDFERHLARTRSDNETEENGAVSYLVRQFEIARRRN